MLIMKYKKITVLDKDLYLDFPVLVRNGLEPREMGSRLSLSLVVF